MSRLQRIAGRLLNFHFHGYDIKENVRPDWLIMSDGARLELDFLIEGKNCAVEVQGEQHYRFIPFFHKDHFGFQQQLKRDAWKKQKCHALGYSFYEIASEFDLGCMIDELKAKQPMEKISDERMIQLVHQAFDEFFVPGKWAIYHVKRNQMQRKRTQAISALQTNLRKIILKKKPLNVRRFEGMNACLNVFAAARKARYELTIFEYNTIYMSLCVLGYC
jgi:hypothetical protein